MGRTGLSRPFLLLAVFLCLLEKVRDIVSLHTDMFGSLESAAFAEHADDGDHRLRVATEEFQVIP